ncbi:MAG TPA: ABC transporter ATP-binding protein [Natronosporangium sp.]
MTEVMLRLEGASKTYRQGPAEVVALAPTDLSIRAGDFVAVMGPSGSGKSTMLLLLGGLSDPTTGRVTIDGHDVASLTPRQRAALRRRSIGFVFQELNLLPGLTALENVTLPLELDGVRFRQARGQALAALERVEMDRFADRFPDELSGGQRQRVAIARAAVGPRRVLLADEPTGALDTVTGEAVMRLLRAHCDGGGTAVMVTHDARLASWADRVIFLQDGRIVDDARDADPSVLLPGDAR